MMFGLMTEATHKRLLDAEIRAYAARVTNLEGDKASLKTQLTTSQLATAQANETIEALKARIAELEKPVPIAKAKAAPKAKAPGPVAKVPVKGKVK